MLNDKYNLPDNLIRYLNIFKRFCRAENDTLFLVGISDYDLELCKAVDCAYSKHKELVSKREIIKYSMEICRGGLNPCEVTKMVNATYNFYYRLNE